MRIEQDSMGQMEVPDNALYGASTQRAVLNFPISNLRYSRRFISALGLVKLASARVNARLGLLAKDKADAICRAATEVIDGTLYDQFVVDLFQTGSGTSTNMNANEVIANRAIEILGGTRGDKRLVHPNDHVNMCQSSNDVIPSAMNIAALQALTQVLLPGLEILASALGAKADEFKTVIKAGRTHLQDATPVTLGQEFEGYRAQIVSGIERLKGCSRSLKELALGGTAVGTGLNTHPDFAKETIREISKESGLEFVEARNHFEAQGACDAVIELSGQLKAIACSVIKIANDIRWLAAGPRCSISELRLPEVQPGSSIMPAKVNPVICESAMMVAVQAIGNDAAVTVAAQHRNFELNTMLPVITHNVLEAVELLGAAGVNLAEKCIIGIQADVEKCREYAEKSLATCTSLAPHIGYDAAAKVAKQAFRDNKTVRQTAKEMGVLSEQALEKALDLEAMTKPGL